MPEDRPALVLSWPRLAVWLRAAPAGRRRVVLTNGCFDILHSGHTSYLAQARALGDLLVVGLNSDASVRRLKGAGRPVNQAGDRAAVLAALRAVDAVVIFEEATPERLIEAVRPDVYVKGGDYRALPEQRLVESLGGRAVILDLVHGRSTTRTIERLSEVG